MWIAIPDEDGLRRNCQEAVRDGFTGKLAIHPAQVPVINECFQPGEAELAQARRIVAAFARNPDLGVVAIDRKMTDLPHLKRAQNLIARAR